MLIVAAITSLFVFVKPLLVHSLWNAAPSSGCGNVFGSAGYSKEELLVSLAERQYV